MVELSVPNGPRLDAGPGTPQGQATAAGVLIKAIRWNGSAWECEPLNVRVYLPVGETQQDIPIAPEDIILTDERKWLRVTDVTRQENRSVAAVGLIEGVRIPPEATVIAAPGDRPRRIPECRLVAAVAGPKPPAQAIETRCVLTVRVTLPGENPVGPATAASTASLAPPNAPPGWAPDKIILTCDLIYRVEPPRVVWREIAGETLRLDGRAWSPAQNGDDAATAGLEPAPEDALQADIEVLEKAVSYRSGVFRLRSAPLPPGWTDNVRLEACPADSAKALVISLTLFQGADNMEGVLTAYVKVDSGLFCLKYKDELEDTAFTGPNVFPELAVATASPALGRQVDRQVPLLAQALETALYLCALPLERNQWGPAASRLWSPDTAVALVPDDKTANPPDLCRLAVMLRRLEDWPDPSVTWSLAGAPAKDGVPAEPALDDVVSPRTGLETAYRAPTHKSWQDGGAPGRRTLACLINAPDGKVRPITGHDDLYSALVVEADIVIAERTRRVRLKVRLGPTKLLEGTDKLEACATTVRDALTREFFLDIDFM